MKSIYKVLRNLVILIHILFMIILIGNFIWGIPADISDRSATEGWVDDLNRISEETIDERIKTGALFMIVLLLLLYTSKKLKK